MTPTPRPWRARAAYAGWALGGVLAIVAIWVVVRDGRPGGPDLWALRTAVARRSSGLNSVVKLVSHLGAAIVIVPVTVVVGAWLVFRRNVRGAIMLAGS